MRTKHARASGLGPPRGLALEALEPRQLLTAYLGQSLADYFHAPLNNADAASESLSYAFNNVDQAAVVNGQFLSYAQVPGLLGPLGFVLVKGVNNSGLVFASGINGDLNFLVQGGTHVDFSDAVTSVVGADRPDVNAMACVEVGNDGTILLELSAGGNPSSAWAFKDGVLTFLWNGDAHDINASGAIVGERRDADGSHTAVLRAPDGTVTNLTGLTLAQAISESGDVAGYRVATTSINGITIRTYDLVRWHAGTVTYLVTRFTRYLYAPGTETPTVAGIDNNGRILITVVNDLSSNPDNPDLHYGAFLYTPDLDQVSLRTVVYGGGEALVPRVSSEPLHLARLASDGQIVIDGALLRPVDESSVAIAADGTLASVGASTPFTGIAAANSAGDVIIAFQAKGQWKLYRAAGRTFGIESGGQTEIRQILAYADPFNGYINAFITTPTGFFWVGQSIDASPFAVFSGFHGNDTQNGFSPIVDHGAMLVNSNRYVSAVGTNPDGDLVMFFEVAKGGGFYYANLAESLRNRPGGSQYVPVAGGLTAFATPWGGWNVAYLDSSGNARVVWWAPGMPTWSSVNLSQDAGFSGTFHGSLVSYVTPWGGLNVAGTDASGNLVALWWAPGLPTWRSDRLVEGNPSQLDENTLTAYVTPWGGLNIAGLDKATGKLTAYWWVPGVPTWTVQEFAIANSPADLHLTGRLSSAVSPTGDLFITAVNADHHLANIWFGAATNYVWSFEDVTMAV